MKHLTYISLIPIIGSVISLLILTFYIGKGESILMNLPEIIALIVAIIGVASALWVQVLQFKKDAQRIDSVGEKSSGIKEDTSDMKPRIHNIERNSIKINEKIAETIVPSMKKLDGIDALVAHMHREEGRNEKISHSLESPDYVLKAIRDVYDKNVELNYMVRELKAENREQSIELKTCREEIASLKAELSKHRARTADRDVPSL